MADRNFRESVVLVTRTPGGETVGVILNRPLRRELSEFLQPELPLENYRDAIHLGGPVMPRTLVAAFRSVAAPRAPALRVRKDLYLSMDPDTVRALVSGTDRSYRLYSGFAGWGAGQLEREIDRGSWYLLPVDEDLVFRKDSSGLWRELLTRLTGVQARSRGMLQEPSGADMTSPASSRGLCPELPGGAAAAALAACGLSRITEPLDVPPSGRYIHAVR